MWKPANESQTAPVSRLCIVHSYQCGKEIHQFLDRVTDRKHHVDGLIETIELGRAPSECPRPSASGWQQLTYERVRRVEQLVRNVADGPFLVFIDNADQLLGERIQKQVQKILPRANCAGIAGSRKDLFKQLEKLILNLRLDWKSCLISKLEQTNLGITAERVETWRQQCHAAGCEDEGDALLKSLDVMPANSVSSALFGTNDIGRVHASSADERAWIQSFQHIVTLGGKIGESSDYIGNLAVKRPATGALIKSKLIRLEELKAKAVVPEQRILIIEDCCLTATELSRILQQVESEKANWMKNSRILLRTCLTSDLGYWRLRDCLHRLGLEQFSLVPAGGTLVGNLSAEGLAAAEKYELFSAEGEIRDPKWIVSGLHLNEGLLKRYPLLLPFCSRAGEQLMALQLAKKCDDESWIRQRIQNWSLGYGGLASMTIFPHCAPKPMLPILRFGGNITFRASRHRPHFDGYWTPLIPPTDEV